MPEENEDIRIGFRLIHTREAEVSDQWQQFYVEPARAQDAMRDAIRSMRFVNASGEIATEEEEAWYANLMLVLDPDSADLLAKQDWVLDYVAYCYEENRVATPNSWLPCMLWGAKVVVGYRGYDNAGVQWREIWGRGNLSPRPL